MLLQCQTKMKVMATSSRKCPLITPGLSRLSPTVGSRDLAQSLCFFMCFSHQILSLLKAGPLIHIPVSSKRFFPPVKIQVIKKIIYMHVCSF